MTATRMCGGITERTTLQAKETPHWLDLALEDPLCKVSYVPYVRKNIYVLHLTQNEIPQQGARNLLFEVVFPHYTCGSSILEKRQPFRTDQIKLHLSSREHPHVMCTCTFPLEKWCFCKMDELLTSLEDQLTMNENLNRGLLMIIDS